MDEVWHPIDGTCKGFTSSQDDSDFETSQWFLRKCTVHLRLLLCIVLIFLIPVVSSEEENYKAAADTKIETDCWRRAVNQSDQIVQNWGENSCELNSMIVVSVLSRMMFYYWNILICMAIQNAPNGVSPFLYVEKLCIKFLILHHPHQNNTPSLWICTERWFIIYPVEVDTEP